MKPSDEKELIQQATDARLCAYAPYSGYKVGAALLAKNGFVYDGLNVETAVHRATHAERMALDSAVKLGEREFKAIAVVTDDPKVPYPCGQCLQDLTEFDVDGDGKLEIIAANIQGDVRRSTLAELLPERFGPINLGIDVRKY